MAPYDTVHVTLRHPALPAATDIERMSGVLPADPSGAPYPVVIVLPGINVASSGYLELAVSLAQAGMVAVTFDWLAELFPGQFGLTPGVDLTAVGPDTYGSKPTTPALAAVLAAVAQAQEAGPLAGLLDLDRIGVFGHSAGGTVALQSARAAWFPQVRAVATYGAHTMASQQLGHAPGTLLPAPVDVPVLLLGGTADGVVAASAIRYGQEAGAAGHDPIERTFTEALPPDTEAWLVRIADAGHMLPAAPEDPTSARGFLEEPPAGDQDRLRSVLIDLVTTFFSARLGAEPSSLAELDTWQDHIHPDIADIRRR
ncbi:dienelactone hydrolase family protein [Aeromicrobium wangtongii]|uniref:Dienelactone hydrolase family protein n=1 Tax=Aeromicrobium wangtongii TaxID=2969247 RepID=A0ABY5M599_9ACTN|nr:dienelactone hydrolase family protein [Aeromicrobium wangtongii]MCD9198621.1 dienelactone hydrolase family protein [Aeromicrobium wangtongii]UUP12647.1 dienelactone hydrolase family protein [Aeromicrobium wangtongii]